MQGNGKRKTLKAKRKELEELTQQLGDPETLGQVRPAGVRVATPRRTLLPEDSSPVILLPRQGPNLSCDDNFVIGDVLP